MKTIKKMNFSREHLAFAIAALTALCTVLPYLNKAQLDQKHQAADELMLKVSRMAVEAKALQAREVTRSANSAQDDVNASFGQTAKLIIHGETGTLKLTNATGHQLYNGIETLRKNAGGVVEAANLALNSGKVSGNIELKFPESR